MTKLVSRKIWVSEKYWNFLTVEYKVHTVEIWELSYHPDFTNLEKLIGFEMVKIVKLDIVGLLYLISRKFCVTEKLLNFHTGLQRVIL